MNQKALDERKKYCREYYREWRKANKEKSKLYQERYWTKRALENTKDPK